MNVPLTKRQYEVMIRRGRGLSTKQIAHELGIHDSRVKNHISEVYTRLDAGSLAEAFTALGWLHVPEQESA